MFDLITIGGATLDSIVLVDPKEARHVRQKQKEMLCFGFGAKIPIDEMLQSIGGNAANVVIGAKLLGLNATIHSFLGDDLLADVILSEFESYKIPTGLVRQQKNKISNYSIILNYRGERTILSHHTDFVYHLQPLPKTKWIYYSSLGKGFGVLQGELIQYLKKNPRTKLAVNPGSYQLRHGIATIRKVLPHTSILIVNKGEAQKILACKKSIKGCLRGLHEKGPEVVVITDGHNGSYAFDGTECLHMPIFPIESIARTGAGDAFSSGFLSAMISGKQVFDALMWGTGNAAGVVQEIGAHKGLQTRRKMSALLRKFKSIYPEQC